MKTGRNRYTDIPQETFPFPGSRPAGDGFPLDKHPERMSLDIRALSGSPDGGGAVLAGYCCQGGIKYNV